MKKIARRLDNLYGRSVLFAESAAQDIRARLIRLLVVHRHNAMPFVLNKVLAPLERISGLIGGHLADTFLASWVSGMEYLYRQFPAWLAKEFATSIRQPPPNEPPWPRFTFYDAHDDSLRFPLIEKAAESLARRNVMSRDEWEAANQSARNQAFFVTKKIENDTIDSIRDALVDDINEGASLGSFKNRIAQALNGSPIGPAHLETVYRTNIQGAFRDGRETLARNPQVSEVFPYQSYNCIHDGRVRDDHHKLESLGLNGTNVYRRDDPFWDYFTPPWGFNCRCTAILMTIADAARAGVTEANIWLSSGHPPLQPEFRLGTVLQSVQPVPGFGSRGFAYA